MNREDQVEVNKDCDLVGGDKDCDIVEGDKDCDLVGGDKDCDIVEGDKDCDPVGGDKDCDPVGGDKGHGLFGGDKDSDDPKGDSKQLDFGNSDLNRLENKDPQQQAPTERPFAHLSGLCSGEFLDAAASGGRSACAVCGRSRKFYCHACCVPVPSGQPLPSVRLPFSVCVLKHPAEFHGKSTSPHAVLLSPECRIVRYPLLPDLSSGRVVVVYPATEALSVAELAAKMAADSDGEDGDKRQALLEDNLRHWTALFVDATWHQASAIINDDRLQSLPRVALSNHSSHYWRHEAGLTPGHLSTIEAIYYFAVDFHLALGQLGYWIDSCGYDGRYDNLLLYFNHLYRLLYANYDGGRACCERKRRHFRLK